MIACSLLAKAQKPVPAFSADVITGCVPLIVKFTDQSANNPTSWKWDLGNGTLSQQQNPNTTYFNAGTYNIKLIVKNAAGEDSLVKTGYIVIHDVPNVNFTAGPLGGCFPLEVTFTDQSSATTSPITSWLWDFGDGNLSTQQNPKNTYNVAGNFGVTLKVQNSQGCFKVINKPGYVKVPGGARALFSNSVAPSCGVPASINFTNNSTGTGVLSYEWDFGDGGTSTQKNPTHVYTTPGVYSVTLITKNNTGCVDTLKKVNLLALGQLKPDFTATGLCSKKATVFTNTSTPVPATTIWNYTGPSAIENDTATNVIKVIDVPGTYTVKMIADFGGCKDSVTKSLVVHAKPALDFTPNPSYSCLVPTTVTFTNFSSGADTYEWNFGDGSGVSTQTSPVHTYTQKGAYDIKLIGVSSQGCRDTLISSSGVMINDPVILDVKNLPYKGCAPADLSFEANITTPETISTYKWDFGDGSPTSSSVIPSHQYTAVGHYDVTLIITTVNGCTDTLKLPQAVTLDNKPSANFSATPNDACAHENIKFTDLTTGDVDLWEWQFGDGGIATVQSPTYSYKDTGYFKVTLIAAKGLCRDTFFIDNYIHIKPPIAKFDTAFLCSTPLVRTFLDSSIGAVTYEWDFGDGSALSTLPQPTHTYTSAGYYDVTMKVTNGGCTHTQTKTVVVNDYIPVITASPIEACKKQPVHFDAGKPKIPSMVTSYIWLYSNTQFEVDSTYTTTFAYPNIGTYRPFIQVIDILGCLRRDTLDTDIKIYGPTADFTATSNGTCVKDTMQFTDNSTTDGQHSITNWSWNFGDGSPATSLTAPFSHIYTATGVYTVQLQVTDAFGCTDTISRKNSVLITNPNATFTADTLKCSSNNIQFFNGSQGVNLTSEWSFGDGGTSTQKNPAYAYPNQGQYDVQLIVTDVFGCKDTLKRKNYIRIADVKAAFNFLQGDTLGLCYPFLIEVKDKSQNALSTHWSFGDGGFSNLPVPSHYYTTPGEYEFKIVADGYGGCVDSIVKTIKVSGPVGSFAATPVTLCSPAVVKFKAITKNNASFIWDYNDGNITNTPDSNVTHSYVSPGSYVPKMILVDANGCQILVTSTTSLEVADVKAGIKMPSFTYCDSIKLNFGDSSVVTNDNIMQYQWTFGDGGTATQQNPVHPYLIPGQYNVGLQVTTQKGCVSSIVLPKPIKVHQSPVIDIVSTASSCWDVPLAFNGKLHKSDTGKLNWQWDFANGNTPAIQNPSSQLYPAAGNYTVKLIATGAGSCADTSTMPVTIHPLPAVDAGPDSTICLGQTILLQGSGAATYQWLAHPTLNCITCIQPSVKPIDKVLYKVTGTSIFGCKNYDSVWIDVVKPFNITVAKGDTLCVGESLQLLASGTDLYTWSPATGLNNPNIPNPIATPTTTTTYTVTATDKKKCFTKTGSAVVKVYPIPVFDIKEAIIQSNVGNNVVLTTTNSPDISKWSWSPAKWLSCYNCPQPTAIIKDNITYKVQVANDGGCSATDEVTIQALCNNANIFIPNTFSPNGDGMNDVFYPRGKGLFSIKSMRVFNRWGQIVFEKAHFDANDATYGWDGSFKGSKLEADVYVYIVEVLCDNSAIIPLKGNVTLIR